VSVINAAPILNRFTTPPVLTWGPISWVTGANGSHYEVQVDNNATFLSPEFTKNDIASSNTPSVSVAPPTPLPIGTYYWRVKACSTTTVCGAWSSSGIFTVDN